jgi:hypothetical protein
MHPGTQSVLDASGTVEFQGAWDPAALFRILTGSEESFWRDRTVLDIGGNTGGLSLELARRGARVTLSEPDPYKNSLALSRELLERFTEEEGLELRIESEGLFDVHTLGRHEIVLCLGLLYHFRYPQLIIDYLSWLEPEYLFLSSQTSPREGLVLENRASPGVLPADYLKPETLLTGWHPTRPLLERMMQSAGFVDVTNLTAERYDYPNRSAGATNSSYYRARLIEPVDPEVLKRVYLPR